jgi:transposase
MEQDTKSKGILASGRAVSIGIDVHKRSWQVTAISEGTVLFRGSIPPIYDSLQRLIRRFSGCKITVAYEAGPCGFGLHDLLERDGIPCLVVPPSLIPVESGSKVKTDKRDSLKVAILLDRRMLKNVFVLSRDQRMDRDLLRTRKQLVHHRADVMRQIKSKLLFHSIEIEGEKGRSWSSRYIRNIVDRDYQSDALKASVEALLEVYGHLSCMIRSLSKQVNALSKTEKYKTDVALLMSIPGVGRLSAMEILTELGDVRRFRSNEHLASFLGLTPSEYSSGEHTRKGRITRCGNKWVRTCLIECSWTLIGYDGVIREKYERIKSRRGAKRAIVAVAKTLAGRIRGLLLRREEYVLGMC